MATVAQLKILNPEGSRRNYKKIEMFYFVPAGGESIDIKMQNLTKRKPKLTLVIF